MSNNTIDRIQQLKTVQDEALQLFQNKNHDYGDAFADYDVVGVLVRLGDKVKRCQSISKKGIQLVDGEKLRDTLIDMHNYAAMAIMLMDECEYETGNNVDELLSQCETDYKSLQKWEIKGDGNNNYIREQYYCYKNKSIINTCTCKSYIYSKNNICKHIQNSDNYRIINNLY